MAAQTGWRQLFTHFRRKRRASHLTGAQHGFVRRLRFERLEDRRLLAGVTVGNTLDVVNGDTLSIANLIANDGGDGISLREAITAANNTGGADTVTFGVGGTVTLGGTQLPVVTGELDILGPAGGITISGNNQSRVFQIGDGAAVHLDRLTITGGGNEFFGGGLYNGSGTLSLTNCTVVGNTSEENGGGLYNASGTLSLTNCTLNGNIANGDGFSFGAALYSESGTVVMTNCTVTGNSFSDILAPGSLVIADGTLSLTNCTVSGNPAGGVSRNFFGTGVVTLTNTIVAANVGNASSDLGGGIDPASSHNLIGTRGSGGLVNGVNGNLVGVADPGLAPLDFYGGPLPTMALRSGSPAIDAGTSGAGVPATDQRGFARAGAVDIGAFEFQTGPLVVNTTNDEVALPQGQLSLRLAVRLANTIAGADTITFGVNGTITLSGQALPTITDDLNVVGPAGGITISGNNQSRIFRTIFEADVPPGTFTPRRLWLDGLTLTNGNVRSLVSVGLGGAVASFGILTVTNCTFSNNDANLGGAIFSNGGLTVNNSTFTNNTAERGGAIYSFGGLTVNNSTIGGNFSFGPGGGIYSDGTLTVSNSTIAGNSASVSIAAGGGIYSSGTLTVSNSTIAGNSTGGRGGGIWDASNAATVTNSTIAGNSADRGGGGIFSFNDAVHDFLLRNSIDAGNTGPGGAADNLSGPFNPSSSHNLIGIGGSGGLVNGVNGNLVGVADPRLGPLADNGGPTFTRALLPGSPAIDAGSSNLIAGLLFNTGVDNAGNVLGDSVDDPHYTILSQPGGGSLTDVTVLDDDFPIPPWVANEPDSRWIGPNAGDAVGPAGNYTYRTTFDLTGLDFDNLVFAITGRWASDNQGTDILLNGVSTGQKNVEFTGYSQFTVSAGFVPGLNTLDFVVNNAAANPSPTGLRVDDIKLTAIPKFDQRGAPFVRVFDGDGADGARMDIGAYELISDDALHALFGDYNRNGVGDAADYVVWRKTLDQTGLAPYDGADGDGDGMIGPLDYGVWRSHFGQTVPLPAAGSGTAALASADSNLEVSESVAPATASAPRFSATPPAFQEVSLAAVATDSSRHNAGHRAATPSPTIPTSASVDDQLLVLLARDRVGRAGRPEFSLAKDAQNDDDPDPDQVGLTNEPLAVALAEWP